MLWFWLAYVCVTVTGILHTVFNIYVLHMKPMTAMEWAKTMKKQSSGSLCIILSCFLFNYLYMKGLHKPTMGEALLTGLLWAGVCIVFDVFCRVLISIRGA